MEMILLTTIIWLNLSSPRLITNLKKQFEQEICLDFQNVFWETKRHIVEFPYIEGFNEHAITTKARPIQMNHKMIEFSIEFSSKFPNEIIDKMRLQRFLGSLNYVADFIPKVRQVCEPLYKRLRKTPVPYSSEQTQAVIRIPKPDAFMIIETDASDSDYGGIIKQRVDPESAEQLFHFTFGI
ncbi:hypothetical protein H5410_061041 [Solanum commersonii]|uniref:Reverse transcriptase/retrotransposon-derived protein RNase H-like domain-containing protein n=1 Tax=Solanum commersonii TaxID=4109 RepID=A0A9J5W6M4_SOLCO|nr:hypothetical protein H5410_061041 [Solanum commersonii]